MAGQSAVRAEAPSRSMREGVCALEPSGVLRGGAVARAPCFNRGGLFFPLQSSRYSRLRHEQRLRREAAREKQPTARGGDPTLILAAEGLGSGATGSPEEERSQSERSSGLSESGGGMGEIGWHRRETRRQTEKTNIPLEPRARW